MARSYKKNIVSGFTTAESEKKDKQQAHGACRVHFRTSILGATDAEAFMFEERNRAHSNVYSFAKDGKQRLDLRVGHLGRAIRVLHAPVGNSDLRHAHKLVAK
jgi:hypothetical protein